MNVKLVFLRRTKKEIEVFGGEVFIDVDGKNVAVLKDKDIEIELDAGKHTIKMYKSHDYNTYIGHAVSEINLSDGEKLVIEYSPPMMVNQPGNIKINNFESYTKINEIVNKKNTDLARGDEQNKLKKQELEMKNRNGVIIFVVIVLAGALIWGLYYGISMANIYG